MRTPNTDKVLAVIGEKLKNTAIKNLRAAGKGGGPLEKSIRWEKIQTKDGFGVRLRYRWYGDVLDKGLAGYRTPLATPYKAGHGRLPHGLEYRSVKQGSGIIPIRFESVREWIRRKRITPRKGSQKSLDFLIHRSIKRDGYPATNWMKRTKSEVGTDFRSAIAKAYAKDVKLFLTQNLRI